MGSLLKCIGPYGLPTKNVLGPMGSLLKSIGPHHNMRSPSSNILGPMGSLWFAKNFCLGSQWDDLDSMVFNPIELRITLYNK